MKQRIIFLAFLISVLTDLILDATGLKVLGEGEWKVKIHGSDKRRGWIKLHIAIDPKSLMAIEITDDKVADSLMLPSLVDKALKNRKAHFKR